MRPLPFLLLGTVAMFASASAPAQTPARMGTPGTPAVPPTLDQRIDGAAGLNSTRAPQDASPHDASPHDKAPLSAPLARGAAVATPTTRALERAGSPAGAPLGTGAATTPTDPDPPTPAAARGDDPRAPG